MNPYLQGRFRFNEARRRIGPVRFYPQSLGAFLSDHPATYDVIHLSNTHHYGGDGHRLVAQAASALRGGQIVIVDYTEKLLMDVNDCYEFVTTTHRYGFPARVVVVPTRNSNGSIKASVLEETAS